MLRKGEISPLLGCDTCPHKFSVCAKMRVCQLKFIRYKKAKGVNTK
jgi:hypothetical protein